MSKQEQRSFLQRPVITGFAADPVAVVVGAVAVLVAGVSTLAASVADGAEESGYGT